MSSTREAPKSRRTKQAAGASTSTIEAAIRGSSNLLGRDNTATHITGNVYVCMQAPDELSPAEREIVTHYREASTQARIAIRSVAMLAASAKRSE
jgi:hypothetical protein